MLRKISLALLGFGLGIFLVWAAHASPSCLTKQEARARWPGQWLYWHTERHCWDNHRGGKRYRYRDPMFGAKVAGDGIVPLPAEPPRRPLLMLPGFDPAPRFVPWEQRVAGSF